MPEDKVQHGHRYGSVVAAKEAFLAGDNITAAVREQEGVDANPPHAIEIAYEMQSGEYAQGARSDPSRWDNYGKAIAEELAPHLTAGGTLLDCGTGEMTSLTSTLNHTAVSVEAKAFDISWSRIAQGRRFVDDHLASSKTIQSFVGDMAAIAVAAGSVDLAMTVHALEPNGGREAELLSSLFAVSRGTVVLFEPCYENASDEARHRMERHGYVRNLAAIGEELGATLVSLSPFALPVNPLNPTWVYVFDVPAVDRETNTASAFECPVTNTPLIDLGDCWFSEQAGLAYPVIGGIPVLRADHAILASQRTGLLD